MEEELHSHSTCLGWGSQLLVLRDDPRIKARVARALSRVTALAMLLPQVHCDCTPGSEESCLRTVMESDLGEMNSAIIAAGAKHKLNLK